MSRLTCQTPTSYKEEQDDTYFLVFIRHGRPAFRDHLKQLTVWELGELGLKFRANFILKQEVR